MYWVFSVCCVFTSGRSPAPGLTSSQAGSHHTPTSCSSNCHLKTPSHYIASACTTQKTPLPTITPVSCVTQPLPSNGCLSGCTVHALSKYATTRLLFSLENCINKMKMGEADIFHFCILVISDTCCASDCHIVTYAVLRNVSLLWQYNGRYWS
jgi:hypothetical protein